MPLAVDTGPIVALLSVRDRHHEWARGLFAGVEGPCVTCEPVLTESCHLLRHLPGGRSAVLALVAQGALRIEFSLRDHASRIAELMARYESVPMSLADASLVRMAELAPDTVIATLDSDFHVYRRDRRHALKLRTPRA